MPCADVEQGMVMYIHAWIKRWGNVPAKWRTPNKGESSNAKAQQVLFLLSCLV